MPLRIDVREAAPDAVDRLIDLGALDVERADDGTIAALVPDGTSPEQLGAALATTAFTVCPATPRDAESVWVLRPRAIRIGRLHVVPADAASPPAGAIRLIDSAVFGTGLHPTTALCLEALDASVAACVPRAVLDVGTGSGILALAALTMGVTEATAIDIDEQAVRVAADNACRNGMRERLTLGRGGPEVLTGTWPLVVANVVAASLIEMAPALVQRVGHRGTLLLSGVARGVDDEVARVYRRLGLHHLHTTARAGWTALMLQASW